MTARTVVMVAVVVVSVMIMTIVVVVSMIVVVMIGLVVVIVRHGVFSHQGRGGSMFASRSGALSIVVAFRVGTPAVQPAISVSH